MVSKTQKEILNPNLKESSPVKNEEEEIENFCDENFSMLQKIHSILLNCSNMSQNQKREFSQNERFFMKQYLQKLLNERQG
ncbi:hypothetical protein LCGC14_1556640 [marine sediment metagenome]|uniref:Uncharacterized protein n=1 Tax=marine sediment metagenome TaxID=412755 RepID=A0A0F9INS0_9ZZZZ